MSLDDAAGGGAGRVLLGAGPLTRLAGRVGEKMKGHDLAGQHLAGQALEVCDRLRVVQRLALVHDTQRALGLRLLHMHTLFSIVF